MAEVILISAEDISDSLKKTTRQYLTGNLKLSQILEHYPNGDVEIGITRYLEPTVEAPHRHSRAIEYQYMISGETAYLNIETNEVFTFKKGDFYVLETGVVYAQKSKANTTILFIKHPGGNDKIEIDATSEVQAWLNQPLS